MERRERERQGAEVNGPYRSPKTDNDFASYRVTTERVFKSKQVKNPDKKN
jgi:hypothetical protein